MMLLEQRLSTDFPCEWLSPGAKEKNEEDEDNEEDEEEIKLIINGVERKKTESYLSE